MKYSFLVLLLYSAFCYSDTTTCEPKCRPDTDCKNGECVSKCNPPCPADLICGGEMGCLSADQYENLTDMHYNKILLAGLATLGGIAITVAGFTIHPEDNLNISKSSLTAARIAGPLIFTLSIPFNLLAWRKYYKAKEFRKANSLPER